MAPAGADARKPHQETEEPETKSLSWPELPPAPATGASNWEMKRCRAASELTVWHDHARPLYSIETVGWVHLLAPTELSLAATR
jgi:hypothetical protein